MSGVLGEKPLDRVVQMISSQSFSSVIIGTIVIIPSLPDSLARGAFKVTVSTLSIISVF